MQMIVEHIVMHKISPESDKDRRGGTKSVKKQQYEVIAFFRFPTSGSALI
jgi:hypothetical protein